MQVTGTVQEFTPASDPASPAMTEIGGSPTVSVRPETYPMPAPVALASADTLATNTLANLERLEGMRVRVETLRVVGPTGGFVTETNGTGSSNGVLFGGRSANRASMR